MDENTLWRGILIALAGLVGFSVKSLVKSDKENKDDIEKTKEKVARLEETRYTKQETDRQIELHVDPIKDTQVKMWDDVKEIKSILMSGKHNG